MQRPLNKPNTAVAHVAANELGAATYAIRAVMASVEENEKDTMGRKEGQYYYALML